MNAYIYQAALLCEDCTDLVKMQLSNTCQICKREHAALGLDCSLYYSDSATGHCEPVNESDYDSDKYPKGPYSDGGGEADCPNHCDHCGIFLENPLTKDGVAYTADMIRENEQEGFGNLPVLTIWKQFYFDELATYTNHLWQE